MPQMERATAGVSKEERRRRLKLWIRKQRSGRVTAYEVVKHAREHWPSVAAARAVLGELMAEGAGRWEAGEAREDGLGRPRAPVFVLKEGEGESKDESGLGDRREIRRRLAEWIKGRPGGRVRARELMSRNKLTWPTCVLAESDLEVLVREGVGRWEEARVAAGAPRRERARWFVLKDTEAAKAQEAQAPPPVRTLEDAFVEGWLQGYGAGWGLRTKPTREDLLALVFGWQEGGGKANKVAGG